MMTLADWLKENPNAYKLAKQIGTSQPYISMILAGKRRPSYKLAIKIEKYTNKQVKRTNWYPNE